MLRQEIKDVKWTHPKTCRVELFEPSTSAARRCCARLLLLSMSRPNTLQHITVMYHGTRVREESRDYKEEGGGMIISGH